MTVCSNALCFNRCEPSSDPAKPPFCDKCKAKSKLNTHGGKT